MSSCPKCPVCSDSNLQKILSYDEFPFFTVPVSSFRKEDILKRYLPNKLSAPLHMQVCNKCNHCFLDPVPNQEIIDDLYSNFYSYPSPLEEQFKPERDDRFLEYFEKEISLLTKNKKQTNILEVGCYDGYILHQLNKAGYEVMGCDPSEGAEIGKEHGINILREFFDAEEFHNNNLTFDIIISRHFIEHVINPVNWVSELSKILNLGGYILLEVPNIQFYLSKGLLEVFSLQHLHGFSLTSISYVLNEAGMRCIKTEQTPENLIVVASENGQQEDTNINEWTDIVSNFNNQFSRKKIDIKSTLKKYIDDNKKIGMWGAGGFGIAALISYEIPSKHISFIIDSDKQKWGMEYLNYSIPIISPEQGKENQPDLLIVSSYYSQSIINQIQEMKFNSSVLIIFPDVKLIESN